MVEPKITRSEIIVIDTIGENEYADLTWTDKTGKDYKVSAKRIKYFQDIIKPGMAVKLSFASAYGKEYIYKAELVSEKLAESASQAPQSQIKPVELKTQREVLKEKVMPSKEKAFALSYSKDLAVAKIIRIDEVLAYAEMFYSYLMSGVSKEIKDEIGIKTGVEGSEKISTHEGEAVTVDFVMASLKILFDAKIWTADSILKRLSALGGKGKTARPAVESLSSDKVREFMVQVNEALSQGMVRLEPSIPKARYGQTPLVKGINSGSSLAKGEGKDHNKSHRGIVLEDS